MLPSCPVTNVVVPVVDRAVQRWTLRPAPGAAGRKRPESRGRRGQGGRVGGVGAVRVDRRRVTEQATARTGFLQFGRTRT